MIGPLKVEKHCTIRTTLAPQTRAVKPEPKFQVPASAPSKSFWLRLWLQPSKPAWAPAPHSTALF